MITDNFRHHFSLRFNQCIVPSYFIRYHALVLLPWVYCAVKALVMTADSLAFAMEALDLKLAKLYVEAVDEILKYVSTLSHKFGRLLISQHFSDVLFGALEVREEEDENFPWVPRDLNQVDDIVDLMEVSVKDLSTHFNS